MSAAPESGTADIRPFHGIRVVDATHVLAGPFATYQLAVLGADVVKVDALGEPDQARHTGGDARLNAELMGTQYLAQASNKRSIAIDLKIPAGRDVLRRLAAGADVFVENYRPGAFEALGLGYDALAAVNERLIYCSLSAFGHGGPRAAQTAYDNVIQATSGLMAMTGTPEVNPIKAGAPFVDYATGTMGAFAIAAALFQRVATGRGQRIDVAMLDVALIAAGSILCNQSISGRAPKPEGNNHRYFATSSCYPTQDGLLMLGAGNRRQQRRLWQALGRPDMARDSVEERIRRRAEEAALLSQLLMERTAEEWEARLQAAGVPAARVRSLAEALGDPHVATRGVVHRHREARDIAPDFLVPLSGFRLAHGGPGVDTPPPRLGEHTDAVLAELGYTEADRAELRRAGAI